MSIAILKRPRQLMLAAIMAIVLSASTLGALGAPQPAAARGGTGVCGTAPIGPPLNWTFAGDHTHGPYYDPVLQAWYTLHFHHWNDANGTPVGEWNCRLDWV
jgi:hypothetical protein